MLRVLSAPLAWLALTLAPMAAGAAEFDEAAHCLALAMYWEARGEGRGGMLAVGAVVLNRMGHGEFPGTACGVVFEGGEARPCQFSWWCDGRSDEPREREAWTLARELAVAILEDRPEDPTGGALFFHAERSGAPWHARRARTVRIGGHVFYR